MVLCPALSDSSCIEQFAECAVWFENRPFCVPNRTLEEWVRYFETAGGNVATMGDDPSDPQPDTGYDDAGVPTFDSVREKIERRYETAIGAQELDSETQEGRTVEKRFGDRQRAAADRLEQIRKSMHEGEH